MRRLSYFGLMVLCAGFVFLPELPAQEMENLSKSDGMPRKKPPGFFSFSRPAKDSPANQLEYANLLLADGNIRGAAKQYRILVHKWHDTPEAVAAQLAYAKLLEKRRRYLRAFNEFQYLIEHFAGSFKYEEVLGHQFRIASQLMTTKRGKLLFFPGFNASERALPLFGKLVRNAPNWEKTPQAQFFIGTIHEQAKDHDPAIKAYETIELRYPGSPFAGKASFNRARCLYFLSNASPRDAATCRKALSALAGFLRRHPDNNSMNTAQEYHDELKNRLAGMHYQQAVFYDKSAKRPLSALIAYNDFIRSFPSAELADKARERVEILELGKQADGDRRTGRGKGATL